jgi:hypothetical protein
MSRSTPTHRSQVSWSTSSASAAEPSIFVGDREEQVAMGDEHLSGRARPAVLAHGWLLSRRFACANHETPDATEL